MILLFRSVRPTWTREACKGRDALRHREPSFLAVSTFEQNESLRIRSLQRRELGLLGCFQRGTKRRSEVYEELGLLGRFDVVGWRRIESCPLWDGLQSFAC